MQYDLQFFAKDGPGGEKTENATSKKLNDAREDGKVAKSKELTSGVDLIILFLVLKIFVGTFYTQFLEAFHEFYEKFNDVLNDCAGGMSIRVSSVLLNEAVLMIIKIITIIKGYNCQVNIVFRSICY